MNTKKPTLFQVIAWMTLVSGVVNLFWGFVASGTALATLVGVICTPLTILRGETEVTLRWAKTPEEFRDMLHSNMEEIDRMERIIESLLLLAKSEFGELSMEMRDLSLSDLVQELYLQGRILGEPKNAIVKQYQRLFELDGVDLEFDMAALEAVVLKAMEKKTGARALRSIMESAMLDIMFELPSMKDVIRCVVTRDVIEKKAEPDFSFRNKEKRKASA